MIRLPKRLEKIVSMVPPCGVAADIGCDHAYVAIALRESGRAEHVLACDVRPGPLQQAEKNIVRAGLSDSIETRLGDGLQPVKAGEADTVIIAGMGGELMLRILNGRYRDFQRFILSPQSDIAKVRETLLQEGLHIEEEAMLAEDGKYYVVLSCVQGGSAFAEVLSSLGDRQVAALPRETLYAYGWQLLAGRDPVLKEFLLRENRRYTAILEKTDKAELRRAWELCRKALEVYV